MFEGGRSQQAERDLETDLDRLGQRHLRGNLSTKHLDHGHTQHVTFDRRQTRQTPTGERLRQAPIDILAMLPKSQNNLGSIADGLERRHVSLHELQQRLVRFVAMDLPLAERLHGQDSGWSTVRRHRRLR